MNVPDLPLMDLLQGVSRTFALSIPELPHPVDEWVGYAYLVCRIVDTVEDRPDTDEADRQKMFDDLVAALGPPIRIESCQDLTERYARKDSEDACDQLMALCDQVLMTVDSFDDPAEEAIRLCALEMIEGLRQTPLPPEAEGPQFLWDSIDGLERYCHYAAGVVGTMLTRLFYYHLGKDPASISQEIMDEAERFGLGLQITNIVKDHPSDLLDQRSFIPPEAARLCGLDPKDILQPELPLAVRGVIVERAAGHLDAAFQYTLRLPGDPPGMRLFCLQPLMMALLTLERVLVHVDITPDDKPKITREQVTEVMSTSRRIVSDDEALTRWYEECRQRVTNELDKIEANC